MKSAFCALLVMVATAAVGVSAERAESQAQSSAESTASAEVWIEDAAVRVPVDRAPDPDRLAAVVVGLRRPGSLHVSVPARSAPRSRASQGAGNRAALLDYTLGNFALGAWASGEREASLALLKFADTVPMGKAVAVRAYYRGTRFIGLTTNPDGAWMAPTDHYRTVTVRGTNVMKAVEENYHCVFDAGGGALCIPPEDLEEAPDGEKNYLRSAIAGSEFSESMRLRRSDLVRYAKTIREELRAFQEDSRPTVFSKLFEEAWSRDRMAGLLRSVGDPADLWWKCLDVDVTKRADCEKLEQVRSSAYVRERLLSMDDFGRMDNALAIAGAHLQAWIALAFRDGIGRSDAVTAVAAGWVAVPDLVALVKTAEVGFASWAALLDEMDARMALLQEMLRSDGMRAEASSEFEDQILTRPAFAGLGDVEFQ